MQSSSVLRSTSDFTRQSQFTCQKIMILLHLDIGLSYKPRDLGLNTKFNRKRLTHVT